MKKLMCLLALSALTLGAADLTGKWSGNFDITNSSGETKADHAYMDLKEEGGNVTGTAGPDSEKQYALRNGKLDGKKLTFEVVMDDGGILSFELTFDGEVIEGTCKGTNHEGEKMSAQLHLKRES